MSLQYNLVTDYALQLLKYYEEELQKIAVRAICASADEGVQLDILRAYIAVKPTEFTGFMLKKDQEVCTVVRKAYELLCSFSYGDTKPPEPSEEVRSFLYGNRPKIQ